MPRAQPKPPPLGLRTTALYFALFYVACIWAGASHQNRLAGWMFVAAAMAVVVGLVVAIVRYRWYRRVLRMIQARASAGLCVHCGYDLHGNESGVCPECGREIDWT